MFGTETKKPSSAGKRNSTVLGECTVNYTDESTDCQSETATNMDGCFTVSSSVAVRFDEIPRDLAEANQWVLWRHESRGGRPTKLPYSATGTLASVTDSTTWSTFEVARQAYATGDYSGVGFVFSADDEFVGIDLDGCRCPETEKLDQWAVDVLDACGWPYAEVSPSKTGVKLFGRGKSPFPRGVNHKLSQFEGHGGKTAAVECYDQGRYFAVTGWKLPEADREPCEIPPTGWDAIKRLMRRDKPAPATENRGLTTPATTTTSAVERCWKYVEKMPDAIEGQDGSGRTYAVACKCFEFGLSDGDAMELMQRFNSSKCSPPWTDRELQHKLAGAKQRVIEAGEFGAIVRDDRQPLAHHRGATAPMQADATGSSSTIVDTTPEQPRRVFTGFTGAELRAKFPTERRHIVEGLFRRREIVNFVAAPKMGKSWLALNLALAVASGQDWLGAFPCNQGRVLLVDNELHPDSLAYRVGLVADQLHIDLDELGDNFQICSARGEGLTYLDLGSVLEQFGPRDLMILDAGYRMLQPGADENDNAAATQNYNWLDAVARRFDVAIGVVLHTSKGNQADRAVTDIGAGAGAQSRAADTHLVLVPHDEPDACVLRCVRRSGRSPDDRVLRRDPNTMSWSSAADLSPCDVAGGEAARQRKREEAKARRLEHEQTEGLAFLKTWWRAHPGEYSERELRTLTHLSGAQRRLPGLLTVLQGTGHVFARQERKGGKDCVIYSFVDRPDRIATETSLQDQDGRWSSFDAFNNA